MPNTGASGTETMLSAGGTTARFDGVRLQVVRGRTTWTLPVRALRSAEATPAGGLRIRISGPPGHAAGHGLGASVELRAPNARSAQAFLAQLTAALAATEPVADGHALVRVERRQPPRRELGPRARAVVRIARVVPVYGLVLFLLGLVSPLDAGTAAATLVAGGVLGLAGGVPLWRAARRVRSLWLLRRRGVGVVGEVTGYVRIWDKGGHLWVFSRMSFTTLDGQRMRDVPSVVTVWGFADRAYAGPVDLVYDPEHPARASRPLTVGFAFRTLLLAAVAALPAAGSVACVLPNLPF
ncbi:hypothetical protein L0F81_31370 [Streptomyces tricolor]|uniref:DUF3592 domain-containing protein n=1 Tax=Streptomyces tricolor TaxID=68277 RepID=A0ABS9JQ99_9ACTN|nr:hypothetical protein [Streptomyces tricolor]MCG0067718.1 hypothetical protein [Streptomyces tricolor]